MLTELLIVTTSCRLVCYYTCVAGFPEHSPRQCIPWWKTGCLRACRVDQNHVSKAEVLSHEHRDIFRLSSIREVSLTFSHFNSGRSLYFSCNLSLLHTWSVFLTFINFINLEMTAYNS